MVILLYVIIWRDLAPTSPRGKLHSVPVVVLIVTISIRTRSVHVTQSFYRYMALYCFQSTCFQCIIIESGIFPWWMVPRWGVGGLHISKERCGYRGGGGVKNKWRLIHLSALGYMGRAIQISQNQDPMSFQF